MFKRLFIMAKPWWREIFVTIFALTAAALLNLVTPELIRRMTSLLGTPDKLTYKIIITYAAVLAVSYILRAVAKYFAMWQAHIAAWKFVADTTLKVYGKLERMSMSFYGCHSTGEIMSRAINDTKNLEVLIAHSLPDLFSSVIIIFFVAIMIFTINPVLAALTLIPVPFVLLISTLFSSKIAPMFRINQEFLGKLNSHFQDRISGMKEIQAFGREGDEYETMTDYCREYSRVNIAANFANAIYQPSVEAVISMGTVIVMGIGGVLSMRGTMSASDIVGFFVYLSMFYQPLSSLARIVEDIQMARAGGVRMLELLDTPEDISDSPTAQSIGRADGKVDFENVSFAYSSGETVLDRVSFSAMPGEMVAIVGATGVGKTTVVSLLERFYDVQGGNILLDGTDIRKITVESLRKNLSIVLQDVFLFNGTIYDNIAYGKHGASREEVLTAARLAHADEFITAKPKGYDTEIGERGMRLSGGQKQRIAIARAVLKDSPVLIFDEATSAVDNETEAQIQTAIDNIAKHRTVIVIAHRLSTVKKADKIIVLNQGKVAECGNHAELIKLGGIYAKMCSVNGKELL